MGLKSTSFFLPATLDTPLLKYEESCLHCKLNGIINVTCFKEIIINQTW